MADLLWDGVSSFIGPDLMRSLPDARVPAWLSGELITRLAARRKARCESERHDHRHGSGQREAGAGSKYEPVFTDRLLATLVHLRIGGTHEALGVIRRRSA
ncbi:hypothetical protein [Streptomyces sp. NRRL B-24720]|uniref:hypothetical protein n=1 Tax=Streptomyces sp. NRRL B-24720 TaxID=1476876 RepID=UPI00131D7C75|nr:hypothetical protein [Streptomyces sp. NRRL B-24720]